jgi:hypothetical protein
VSDRRPSSEAAIFRKTSAETNFLPSEIDFIPRRNRPETQDCNHRQVINSGVDSMTVILRLIYLEYCRACLLHFKYL